ncbi:WAT1-related protein At1g25270-like [Prunus avium]|uniref:WAT1-related protein n=1 Tax=Prunus avium TaxID=42229 RepID=A0A6P5T901_PRUAV|nr:WAT1-related protein At1g25270-like [Prunus avium]
MVCVRICNALHGLKPVLVMFVSHLLSTGLNIIFKLIANDGMSLKVFSAYRVLFASAVMIPLALVFERNKRPKMTWTVLAQIFLCALFGMTLAQNLYLESMVFIPTTFTVAIVNLIPVFTFILAVCFRQEKLGLRSLQGIAKLAGTLVGIGGAMLFVFYKGITINVWHHTGLLAMPQSSTSSSNPHHSNGYVLGAVLALLSCLSTSAWLIIQGKLSKTYPCPLSNTALMSVMGTVQCVVFALSTERDWSQWKLGWNIRLLGVFYAGILGSGVVVFMTTWCVNMRGPLFVASFSPVLLVLVAIFCSLLLGEKLYLGSFLGGFLIICGLYLVIWGKSIEMRKMTRVEPIETPRPSELFGLGIETSTQNAAAFEEGS